MNKTLMVKRQRESKQDPSNLCTLPTELVFEILLLVSIDDAVKCTHVCRAWRGALLQMPGLFRSLQHPQHRLLLRLLPRGVVHTLEIDSSKANASQPHQLNMILQNLTALHSLCIKHGPFLQFRLLTHNSKANKGRSAPKYPKTLKHVHLICGEAINVSTLESFLKSCEHLESLHLQDKGFPPSFLACISELYSLTQLIVSHVQAVRISPKLGVQCPSLTRLTLDRVDLDRVRNLRSSMAAFPHALESLCVTNMRARFREDVCEFLRVLLACVAVKSNRLSWLSLSFDSSVAAVCRRIALDLEWFERCKLVQVSFERCILGPVLLHSLATYAQGVDNHLDAGSLRPNLLSSVQISNCVIEDGGHMDARLSRIISIQ
ncbi:hypothetical protein BJ741DRAFT_68927 [Chytriomyces cf. hyalinus JEL632]|nr:hypothetical protein BJ741DRAFT_68927 [Chytriomyces cf. hyalinus JEL632]